MICQDAKIFFLSMLKFHNLLSKNTQYIEYFYSIARRLVKSDAIECALDGKSAKQIRDYDFGSI